VFAKIVVILHDAIANGRLFPSQRGRQPPLATVPFFPCGKQLQNVVYSR